MARYGRPLVIVAAAWMQCGCSGSASQPGGEFILHGLMTVAANPGICKIFQADDGFTYHLRQGVGLPNGRFDAVNTIGAFSRLRVAARNDLPVACQIGTVVVVLEVLESTSPEGEPLDQGLPFLGGMP